VCLLCLFIAAGISILLFFVAWDKNLDSIIEGISNNTIVGDAIPFDPTKHPDYGSEELYAIKAYTITYTADVVTVSYKISDYILDSSIGYKLYNNSGCREGGNDITDQSYLFVDIEGDDTPQGLGDAARFVTVDLKANFLTVPASPIYFVEGFDKATISFCLAFTVLYNEVVWWDKEEEVNFVETYMEIDVNSRQSNAIIDVRQTPITAPKYKL